MSKINEAKRLLKEVFIANLTSKNGLAITPLFSGPHGIGKTQMVKAAAKELGGVALTLDGSVIKEGEVVGLPLAYKAADGSMEVKFVPHYIVSQVKRLEKALYEKLTTEGLLNGKYKLTEKGLEITEDKKTQIIEDYTATDRILMGDENKYKFGKNLTPEQKLELIESGEVTPIIVLIDELNRAESQTMKELMNIILNKNINGYELPWYLTMAAAINPCSQNSVYATNEMDPAQLDRFCKILVSADQSEFIEYGIESGMNIDFLSAIASIDPRFFIRNEKGYTDEDKPSPSPRSWEMCAHLYEVFDNVIGKCKKFFTDEELSSETLSNDLSTLVIGKVGRESAAAFFEEYNNKGNKVDPEEIFDKKDKKIPESVIRRINNLGQIRKRVLSDSVTRWLCANHCKIEENKKKSENGKTAFENYMGQVSHFTEILDESTKMLFVKKLATSNPPVLAEDGKPLYSHIAKAFSVQILQKLAEFRQNVQTMGDK